MAAIRCLLPQLQQTLRTEPGSRSGWKDCRREKALIQVRHGCPSVAVSTSRALALGGFNGPRSGRGTITSGRRTSFRWANNASATSVAPTTEDESEPVPQPSPWGIEVEEMYVKYGEGAQVVDVLKGINLRVPRGTLFMLLGPNG